MTSRIMTPEEFKARLNKLPEELAKLKPGRKVTCDHRTSRRKEATRGGER
jgi:hypothetical protein